MGRYRLGDIIRMTRKSLSITQEELCEDICSVETLSRIENGNQNPTKDNYEMLMERMGRIRERAYAMLSVSDLKILDKKKLFEDYIKRYEYKKAEDILQEIKEMLGDSILDQQFLIRAENLVNYRMNRIITDDFLEGFEKAIRLTIPKYGVISLAKWPLSFNEAMLLVNISIAHSEKNDYQRAINVIYEVYEAMKQSYMDEEQRCILQVTIASNLSKWYGLIGDHKKAIEISYEGISLCKKFKLGNVLPNLLYGIVWNNEQLINLGGIPPMNRNESLKYLKQAYFIASVMQLSLVEIHIKQHIETNYNIILP